MSRVLVIDDNVLIGEMLKEALSDQGYEVKVALDANEGYAFAQNFHPDLMLIDVQLPDVVGFDLVRMIKNRDELRHIPIIMITGTAQRTEEKVKAFQMGADDYVLKPFEMAELLERVRALLRRSQSRPTEGKSAIPTAAEAPVKNALADVKALSIKDALTTILLTPFQFPEKAKLPAIGLAIPMACLAMVLGGLAIAAGSPVKPAVAGLSVVGSWLALLTVFVMCASLSGIPMAWAEGSRLFALAGIPILFKLGGGLVSTIGTTLSPFYFTASPALFFSSVPIVINRIDLFEIWSIFLLWILLRKHSGATTKKAWIVASIVWAAGWAIAAGLSHLGGGA